METEKTKLVSMMKIINCLFFLMVAIPIQAQQNITRKLLVEEAIVHSNLLQIQDQRAALSLQDRMKARFTYFPNIDLNASYTHLNDNIMFSVPPIQIPVNQDVMIEKQLDPIILQGKNIFRTSIDAKMVLFTGLRAPHLASAAYHKYRADLLLKDKHLADLIIEVLGYYDRLALIDQSLEVLKESKLRLDKQAEFSKKALQAGLISSYDLNKIKIARQEIRKKEIEIEGKKGLVILKLQQLTGLDQETFKNTQVKLDQWSVIDGKSSVENRPEIKALEEAILASDYKRRAENSAYLPQVMAFGKRELYEEDLSALDPAWYLGVGLKWSLFDGLQRGREIQKAKIERNIREIEKREAVQQLTLNLENRRQELSVANQLIEVNKEQVQETLDALNITLKEYELGLADINDRLAAENDHQTALLDYLQAIYDQRMASLHLMAATGDLSLKNIN